MGQQNRRLNQERKLAARDACAEDRAADLELALKNLIDASAHMSPFGGESSVKAVRRAGKYMEALDAARRLIGDDE